MRVLSITAVLSISQAARIVRQKTAAAGQRTLQGCTCRTECDAGLGDGYTCDTCKTSERGCGIFSLTGRYDYCDYSEGSFDAQTADQKDSYYRTNLLKDLQRTAQYENPFGNFVTAMMTSFDNYMPEMPAGRRKLIHSIGAVCEFELVVNRGSPYTGLFASGRQTGFIRMGSAADLDAQEGVTPGIGIKMLRTGIHSGDTVLLHTLELGQSYNFFEYNMSNHIPPAGGLSTIALAKKFEQASQCSPQVGLSDMARYSRDGTEHSPPRFPFKVLFVPTNAVQTTTNRKSVDQLNAEMSNFPIGTTLYTVYACGSPLGDEMTPTDGRVEQVCGNIFEMGALKTTSQCLPSKYGDEAFHIRHQRIEEDWALRPDFLKSGSYDGQRACGRSGSVSADGAPASCGADGMLDGDA